MKTAQKTRGENAQAAPSKVIKNQWLYTVFERLFDHPQNVFFFQSIDLIFKVHNAKHWLCGIYLNKNKN